MPDSSSARHALSRLRQDLQKDNPKPAIQSAISIARSIETELKTNPLVVLAELFVQLQGLPAKRLDSPSITTLTLFFHLAKLNNYNMSSATTIAAGLLLSLETETLDSARRAEARRLLYRGLNKLNFTAASDILRIAKLINVPGSSNYYARFRLSLWQWFALTSTLLTSAGTKESWQDRLPTVFAVTPFWYHSYLAKLLVSPSFIPPGTLVKNGEKSMLMLFSNDDNLMLFDGKKTATYDKLDTLIVTGVAKPRQLIAQIEASEFKAPYPEHYRINHPPRTLTSILEQVHAMDCDIDKLASDIEHESSLANFMRESATNANRLNLEVSSVKQAIMTYGIERIGDMLVTYALFQRLTQSNFPLRDTLIDHIQLSMALGAELADRTKIMLPQTCSLLILVCQTALFTNAIVKSASHWSLTDSNSLTDYAHIHPAINTTEFKVAAVNIGKAWRLPKSMLAKIGRIFDNANATTNKTVVLMRLVLHWSLLSKKGELQLNSKTNALETKLMSVLSLSSASRLQCLQAVSEQLRCSLSSH